MASAKVPQGRQNYNMDNLADKCTDKCVVQIQHLNTDVTCQIPGMNLILKHLYVEGFYASNGGHIQFKFDFISIKHA